MANSEMQLTAGTEIAIKMEPNFGHATTMIEAVVEDVEDGVIRFNPRTVWRTQYDKHPDGDQRWTGEIRDGIVYAVGTIPSQRDDHRKGSVQDIEAI